MGKKCTGNLEKQPRFFLLYFKIHELVYKELPYYFIASSYVLGI